MRTSGRWRPTNSTICLRKNVLLPPSANHPPAGCCGAWFTTPGHAALGGVAGHAGLFATADDLANFAQMILDGGRARAAAGCSRPWPCAP